LLSYIQLSARTVHTKCVCLLQQRPLGPRQEHSTRRPHGQRHGFNSKGCECQALSFQRRISPGVRDLDDKCTTEVLSVSRVRTDRMSKTPDRPQVSWRVLEPPLRDALLQTWATIFDQLSQKDLTRSLLKCEICGRRVSHDYGTPRILRYGSFLFLRLQVVDRPFWLRYPPSSIFQAHGIPCVLHAPGCQILVANHPVTPPVVGRNPRQIPQAS
jgi:hypothetical protein